MSRGSGGELRRYGAGSLAALPELVERFFGGRGHVADLGPAGCECGEGANPVGFVGAAAEIEFL